MTDFAYVGDELELFAHVRNWKAYYTGKILPDIGGSVLEVGAGLGETTVALVGGRRFPAWLCLEPDAAMAAKIAAKISDGILPAYCQAMRGFLADLPEGQRFDTILYIDVMEHLDDDGGEFQAAARHLNPGGRLIVVSPAHMWLYSPFDKAIGHFRRYDKASLKGRMSAPGMVLAKMFYLDSVGLAASLANRLLLKQSMPTPQQLQVWDRLLVPMSRIVDPLLRYGFGKQIIGVWTRR